jgi:hypothetical protein
MGTEQQQATKPSVAWITAGIAIMGFLGTAYGLFSGIERRVDLNAERNNQCAERHAEIREDIRDNEEGIQDLWRHIQRLPDPAETESWKRLESRVGKAARMADKVTYLADRVAELQKEVRDSVKYHREVMAPLVRHSNDLQAQRNQMLINGTMQ